jgi:hypothetical protein
MHHGQKHWETAHGGYVLGLTTGKNPGKLPLVAHGYSNLARKQERPLVQ